MVLQRRQRNIPKSVLHEQNLSFCLLALIKHIIIGLLSYCLSRCRRRRLAEKKTNKIMQAYLLKAKLILLNNRGDFSNINRSCGE